MLKMGHFGEIRLADPVFSAVVLPTFNTTEPQVKDQPDERATHLLIPPFLKHRFMYYCRGCSSPLQKKFLNVFKMRTLAAKTKVCVQAEENIP